METTIKIYGVKKLKRYHPGGFDIAFENFQNGQAQESPAWSGEIVESFKAIFSNTDGITLEDWSIGGRGTGCRVSFSQDETAELSGPRAIAWLENNLLSGLRITAEKAKEARKKYKLSYKIGEIGDCPLTGVCFDEDFLDSLQKDVKDGMDLKAAFEDLARVAEKLIDGEAEHEQSEEYFLEHAESNEYQYTKAGQLIRGGA